VFLLFDSGIRASELTGLRDEDIDWERGLISVYGKGAKERSVPVSAKTLRVIRRYMTRRDKAGHGDTGSPVVGQKGTPLTYWGLSQLLKRLENRTWLEVRAHKFQHSFAVNALRFDAPITFVQDALGHRDM
jgi:site-specific recombinase XerD